MPWPPVIRFSSPGRTIACVPRLSRCSISPANSQLTVCRPVCGCGATSIAPVDLGRAVVVGEAPGADQRPGPLGERPPDPHRPRAAQGHLARGEDLDGRAVGIGGRGPVATGELGGGGLGVAHARHGSRVARRGSGRRHRLARCFVELSSFASPLQAAWCWWLCRDDRLARGRQDRRDQLARQSRAGRADQALVGQRVGRELVAARDAVDEQVGLAAAGHPAAARATARSIASIRWFTRGRAAGVPVCSFPSISVPPARGSTSSYSCVEPADGISTAHPEPARPEASVHRHRRRSSRDRLRTEAPPRRPPVPAPASTSCSPPRSWPG